MTELNMLGVMVRSLYETYKLDEVLLVLVLFFSFVCCHRWFESVS